MSGAFSKFNLGIYVTLLGLSFLSYFGATWAWQNLLLVAVLLISIHAAIDAFNRVMS